MGTQRCVREGGTARICTGPHPRPRSGRRCVSIIRARRSRRVEATAGGVPAARAQRYGKGERTWAYVRPVCRMERRTRVCLPLWQCAAPLACWNSPCWNLAPLHCRAAGVPCSTGRHTVHEPFLVQRLVNQVLLRGCSGPHAPKIRLPSHSADGGSTNVRESSRAAWNTRLSHNLSTCRRVVSRSACNCQSRYYYFVIISKFSIGLPKT